MKIQPFYSQDIYSLLLYIVNNKHLFILNMEIHNFSTRNNSNLQQPITNVTKFQTGAYYPGIKILGQS
jgi:hypothetical protein